MSKLRSDMDEMELVLDQWKTLQEKINKVSEMVNLLSADDNFSEYQLNEEFGIYSLEEFFFYTRGDLNRLSACMKLAAYTLAGQLAMLPAEKCKWTVARQAGGSDFVTACKKDFWFESGIESYYKFCITCGKEIEFCVEDDEPEAA